MTSAARRQVNIHETKTNLSKLLARVEAGEEIVIARAGKPIAKIVRFPARPSRRKGGFWKGLFTVPDDFIETSPEIIADFEDGPIFP